MKTFSLRTVKLRPGEEFRDAVEVELAPVELGGQRYIAVPDTPQAELVVARATTGTDLQLRFDARLHGPCMRCLEDAVVDRRIEAREYQATSPDAVEELTTPYVEEDNLDVSQWAHDALILALPDKILCRDDCAGLCPVCGRNLNDEPHSHDETPTDPRWDALGQLKL